MLGLAVIAGIAPSFTLVWPASLPSEPKFPPAIEINESPIGQVVLWPTRETGVGRHLLHRRLGAALPIRTMIEVTDTLETDEPASLEFAATNISSDLVEDASDALVDKWERICLHEWPTFEVGSTAFDGSKLTNLGFAVGDIAQRLAIATPDAVALIRGETLPTAEQVQTLAASVGVEPVDLLRSVPGDLEMEMLASDIKDDLVRIGESRGIGEAETRRLLRADFALAARSDGNLRSQLDAAIHRLLSVQE